MKYVYDGHFTIPRGHGRGFMNGSDALHLMLYAKGLQPGVPSGTAGGPPNNV